MPQRTLEKGPPTVPKKTRLNDYDLFVHVRRIAGIIVDAAKAESISYVDRRGLPINPRQRQTASGLFLETVLGKPQSIWTPWGDYGFFGGVSNGPWNLIMPLLYNRLRAVPYVPDICLDTRFVRQVFAINRVGTLKLPEPQELDPSRFAPYEVALAAWEEHERRYAGTL
jgi:hypothetical protein